MSEEKIRSLSEAGKNPLVVVHLERLRRAAALRESGDAACQAAVAANITDADAALDVPILSVMDKGMSPPSRDKHDYMSLGPYWWPDPEQPEGRPYIRRDGQVNPESTGSTTDRPALEMMASRAETTALAAFYTFEQKYADASLMGLRAWFLDDSTRMNPHLEYSQSIPGRTAGRGIGLIDNRVLIRVVNALVMLKASGYLADEEYGRYVDWFGRFLDWMLTSDHGRAEKGEHNNHGTWYDAQVVCFARFVGRDELAREVVAHSVRERLLTQIEADGRQPHELARTRSFSYSVMNLSGFFLLADQGLELGVDLWQVPSGRESRLRAALTFLSSWIGREEVWPYQQITEWSSASLLPLLHQGRCVFGAAVAQPFIEQFPVETVQRQRSTLLWPVEEQVRL